MAIDEETRRKRAEDGQKAMRDYIAEAQAVDEKTAKLRALRLAQAATEKPAKRKRARSIPVEKLNAANDK